MFQRKFGLTLELGSAASSTLISAGSRSFSGPASTVEDADLRAHGGDARRWIWRENEDKL